MPRDTNTTSPTPKPFDLASYQVEKIRRLEGQLAAERKTAAVVLVMVEQFAMALAHQTGVEKDLLLGMMHAYAEAARNVAD